MKSRIKNSALSLVQSAGEKKCGSTEVRNLGSVEEQLCSLLSDLPEARSERKEDRQEICDCGGEK